MVTSKIIIQNRIVFCLTKLSHNNPREITQDLVDNARTYCKIFLDTNFKNLSILTL